MNLKETFLHYLVHEHVFPVEVFEILSYRSIRELPDFGDAEIDSDVAAAPLPPQASLPEIELDDLVGTAKASGTLGMYIRQLAHTRDMVSYRAALFESGQISRDYWSRLLNDEVNASKNKLLRVAVLLKLSREEAVDLLVKAGYSLSPMILRDVIVGYCLLRGIYDFAAIEDLLADRDVQSLFNDRRGG